MNNTDTVRDVSQRTKPPARLFHSAVVHENSMIVFGGTSSVVDLQDRTTPWVFNLTTLKWRENINIAPAAIRDRYGHSAVMLEQDMVVFGGTARTSNVCLADTWKLSTVSW